VRVTFETLSVVNVTCVAAQKSSATFETLSVVNVTRGDL
jgi:hypothetical protein